jgi:hypothetical protein
MGGVGVGGWGVIIKSWYSSHFDQTNPHSPQGHTRHRPTATTTTMSISTITTAAGRIIQRRATTGSASSIFYLRQAGVAQEQAAVAERAFFLGIGVPLALLGMCGIYSLVSNEIR